MKTHHSTCGWFAIAIILAMTLAVSPSCPATSAEAGGIVLARAGPGGRRPGWADRVRAAGEGGLGARKCRSARSPRTDAITPPILIRNGAKSSAGVRRRFEPAEEGRRSQYRRQWLRRLRREDVGLDLVGYGIVPGVSEQARPAKAGTWPLQRSRPTRQLQPTTSLRLQINTQANFLTHGSAFSDSGSQRTRRMLWLAAVHPLSDPGAPADRNAGIGGAWRQPPAFLPYGPCYRSTHPGR